MLTRRGFVRLMGGAAALAAVPLPGCGDNERLTRGLFFDEHQWETIDLATGIVLPGDLSAGGAREAVAVRYIDQLLAAFDVSPPAIFASGPFSGRTSFPDGTTPPNDFTTFLPLSRVKEIAWRTRIFGSAQTPGGDFNDALLGSTIGLRDLYTDAVQRLDRAASDISKDMTFRLLSPADQSLALDTVASDRPDFWQALVEHTLEGTLGAPEYGGNAFTAGWHVTRYDGDSAPLGHATYDAATDAYVDRPDQPTSQPSPGDHTETFSDDVLQILTIAAIGSGGKRFF